MEHRKASTAPSDSISHCFILNNSSMEFYNSLMKKMSPLPRKVTKNHPLALIKHKDWLTMQKKKKLLLKEIK